MLAPLSFREAEKPGNFFTTKFVLHPNEMVETQWLVPQKGDTGKTKLIIESTKTGPRDTSREPWVWLNCITVMQGCLPLSLLEKQRNWGVFFSDFEKKSVKRKLVSPPK